MKRSLKLIHLYPLFSWKSEAVLKAWFITCVLKLSAGWMKKELPNLWNYRQMKITVPSIPDCSTPCRTSSWHRLPCHSSQHRKAADSCCTLHQEQSRPHCWHSVPLVTSDLAHMALSTTETQVTGLILILWADCLVILSCKIYPFVYSGEPSCNKALTSPLIL